MNKTILQRILNYCSYRERSENEVRKKIIQMGIACEEDIENMVNYLKEIQLLSNNRFLETYIRGKIRIKKWGPLKILSRLVPMGFEQEIIMKILSNYNDEIKANCKKIMEQQKIRHTSESGKQQMKIMRYLYGKGYPKEIIEQVTSES